jgi:hypothetical protein
MNGLRESVRNFRRRRAFARILRANGYKPKRVLIALALAFDMDRPQEKP